MRARGKVMSLTLSGAEREELRRQKWKMVLRCCVMQTPDKILDNVVFIEATWEGRHTPKQLISY